MKKYLILLTFLLTISIYSIDIVSANWLPTSISCTKYNATTLNSGVLAVPKFEGIFQYCVKQEILENPYSGGTITFDGVNYIFVSSSGISSNLGSSQPNQAQFLGNYIVKSKIYKFDKTPPNSCTSGTGTLYYGSLPAVTPLIAYTGAWTNQEIFGRVNCTDGAPGNLIQTVSGDIINIGSYTIVGSSVYLGPQLMVGYSVLPSSTRDISGCEQSFYDNNISHGASGVLLTLRDNAGNANTATCPYNHTVLKDSFSPVISVKDQSGSFLDIITDPTFQSGTMLATDSTFFNVTVEDITDGSNAVSGIKSYSATVTQIADYQNQPITPVTPICDVPLNSFAATVDSTYAYNTPDRREFQIICNNAPSFRKTGVYNIEIYAEDHAGNIKNFQTRMIVYPNPDIHIVENLIVPTPGPVNSDGIALHTFNALVLDKFDNPVYNFPINNITHTGAANIYINEVNGTGNPLFIRNSNSTLTSATGVLTIDISSIAPGDIATGFSFGINKWDSVLSYIAHSGISSLYSFGDGSEKRLFLRPYTSTLSIDPSDIILGYTHTGSLGISLESFAPSTYTIHDFLGSLSPIDPNMILSYTSVLNSVTAFFTPEQVGGNILDFKIKTHPYVTYTMSGINVTSYVTPDATDSGSTWTISGNSGAVNRIYVVGNKHTYGKDGYVSTISDITTTPTIDIKNTIRKNATIAVRGRVPDTASAPNPKIVRGIKYITGDYTIGDSEAISRNWETLIVTDGNVTVDTAMFNTDGKEVAILVLRDDLNDDKGNLFIKPNVRYVSSLIYTDASIESVDLNGVRFTSMDKVRSDMLSNQLVLKGVFISRNTIGGAVKGSNASGAGAKKYTLPGNIGTDDLLLAARYDLAFLRSFNNGYDNPAFTQPYNLGNNAFTVVIYDGDYMQFPPPGFSTRP